VQSRLRFVGVAVDETLNHMSGTGRARHYPCTVDPTANRCHGAAMPSNASIEYFPAPVMDNSKKPPIMLRSL
jgi:hypothetical protein